MARFGFSLRSRRAPLNVRQAHNSAGTPPAPSSTTGALFSAARKRAWPSPTQVVLSGPQLLLRGPRLLLRAPGAVLRAPGLVRGRTQRLFSASARRGRQEQNKDEGIKSESGTAGEQKGSFTCELHRCRNQSSRPKPRPSRQVANRCSLLPYSPSSQALVLYSRQMVSHPSFPRRCRPRRSLLLQTTAGNLERRPCCSRESDQGARTLAGMSLAHLAVLYITDAQASDRFMSSALCPSAPSLASTAC